MKKYTQGYTLVELMIALVLGLIIVLAAVQMLLSGQKSIAFQSAMANVQDNANIGLNYVVSDLKHTNLNLINRDMKSTGISGLVISNLNFPSNVVTNRKLGSSSTGASLVSEKSDVLVVQYKPNLVGGYDCEGNKVEKTDEVIVQRYFLRLDTNGTGSDLALACDAGRYTATATAITGLNDKDDKGGQIIMQRVDQFKVMVGVQNTQTRKMSYMTLSQFGDVLITDNLRAVSLQIGLLVRSLDNSGTNTEEKTTYRLLNTNQKVEKPKGMNAKFLRIPVEQTIALKNGLGERL